MANQPYWNPSDKDTGCTLSNSDRTASQAAFNTGAVRSTTYQTTGKFYVEIVITSNVGFRAGVANSSYSVSSSLGGDANAWVVRGNEGDKINNNTATSYGSGFSLNDVLMIAVDIDAGKIWWGKNGSWFASGNPSAGTGAGFSGLSSSLALLFGANSGTGTKVGTLTEIASYAYSPPSGFTAGWGGAEVLTATGVANASAFGAPLVKGLNTLVPTGILNSSDYGAAAVIIEQFLTTSGFVNTTSFGAPIVDSGESIIVPGIENVSEIGSPTLTTAVTISASGIENESVFGTTRFTLFLIPNAVVNTQSFGTTAVRGRYPLVATSIVNTSAIGIPAVARLLHLTTTGIENTSVFGSYVLIFDQRIISAGVANLIEFGTAVITRERNYKPVRRNLNSIIRMRM